MHTFTGCLRFLALDESIGTFPTLDPPYSYNWLRALTDDPLMPSLRRVSV